MTLYIVENIGNTDRLHTPLAIIIDLPIGFPINSIMSLSLSLYSGKHREY